MLGEERRKRIHQAVLERGVVHVVDLSRELQSTEATIRRDLDQLQAERKLRRIHGGATVATPSGQTTPEAVLKTRCVEEKKAIAKRAHGFLSPGETVFMGASTTVLELANLIVADGPGNLTVITNSFVIVRILAQRQDVRVIHTGGEASWQHGGAEGLVAEQAIRSLHGDKCFLGANGIAPDFGYSSPTFPDASLKRCMCGAANEVFVLADHTKFGERYLCQFAEFQGDVDCLITDILPEGRDLEAYQSCVRLLTASEVGE